MKLLSSPASPYTRKVRIVLTEKKIECELETVDVAPAENRGQPAQPARQDPDAAAGRRHRALRFARHRRVPRRQVADQPADSRGAARPRRRAALGSARRRRARRRPAGALRGDARRERAEQGLERQAARSHQARHGADGGRSRRAALVPRRALFACRHRGGLLPRLAQLPQARRHRLARRVSRPRKALREADGAAGVRRHRASARSNTENRDRPRFCSAKRKTWSVPDFSW